MAEGAGTTRVLVVDDEANLVELVQGYLERDGYQVLTAADGPSAVALARELRPDLMVLDLMLPRMDGYKVCRALKFDERYKHIPIFILSARSGDTDRRLALEMGADEVHTKPYDMRTLVNSIRARLEQREDRAAA